MERKNISEGLESVQRYEPLFLVLFGVEGTIVKSVCPVHGKWYFKRIGETNRFRCLHSDHAGYPSTGLDEKIDPCFD